MQPSSKMLWSSSPDEGATLCLSSPHKKCQSSPPSLDKCCKATPLKKYHKAATTKCFSADPLRFRSRPPLTLKPSLVRNIVFFSTMIVEMIATCSEIQSVRLLNAFQTTKRNKFWSIASYFTNMRNGERPCGHLSLPHWLSTTWNVLL